MVWDQCQTRSLYGGMQRAHFYVRGGKGAAAGKEGSKLVTLKPGIIARAVTGLLFSVSVNEMTAGGKGVPPTPQPVSRKWAKRKKGEMRRKTGRGKFQTLSSENTKREVGDTMNFPGPLDTDKRGHGDHDRGGQDRRAG